MRIIEIAACVSCNRRKDLRSAGNRSRVRHDRFPDAAGSPRLARDCSRSFPPMNHMVCRASVSDAEQFASESHRDALQFISTALIGIWRAFAVVFFSLCALAHNAITLPFVPRTRRLHARAAWLHDWCRFACRVLGVRITTRGSMPTSGLLVSNHLSYLDIIVFSSIQRCVFVAKHEVATWPLFGWLARFAGTIFVDRERRYFSAKTTEMISSAIAGGLL